MAGNRWFESTSLQRRVNELSVPLDEGVFEPPDLLQTRMNGGAQSLLIAGPVVRIRLPSVGSLSQHCTPGLQAKGSNPSSSRSVPA